MSLSRKFYEDIAKRFADLKPADPTNPAYTTWEGMVAETANSITAMGATFNRGRFYGACGLITIRSGQ